MKISNIIEYFQIKQRDPSYSLSEKEKFSEFEKILKASEDRIKVLTYLVASVTEECPSTYGLVDYGCSDGCYDCWITALKVDKLPEDLIKSAE